MRRILSMVCAVLLCMTLACPVLAAAGDFAPSISYKDGPAIEGAEMNGMDVSDSMAVSSIKNIMDQSTNISQEDRELLLEVYEKISNGTMKVPMKSGYEIRELVDVSFTQGGNAADYKDWLNEEGNTITMKFALGVKRGTRVQVFSYADGAWIEAEDVKNNGDTTVTVVFEHLCPVVFCVEKDSPSFWEGPPRTGDMMGQQLTVWIALMAVSVAALIAVVVIYRRKSSR